MGAHVHNNEGLNHGIQLVNATARIGDQIETEMRHPYPHAVRMTLLTAQACAFANELLAGRIAGWRLLPSTQQVLACQHQATRAQP